MGGTKSKSKQQKDTLQQIKSVPNHSLISQKVKEAEVIEIEEPIRDSIINQLQTKQQNDICLDTPPSQPPLNNIFSQFNHFDNLSYESVYDEHQPQNQIHTFLWKIKQIDKKFVNDMNLSLNIQINNDQFHEQYQPKKRESVCRGQIQMNKQVSLNYQKRSVEVLNWYQNKMTKLAIEANQLKQKLIEAFNPELENFYKMQSSILSQRSDINKQRLQFILKSLNNPQRLELIYRGSENQFKASIFHQKCDNTYDTFILIHTQFDKLIGGFTHYRWNQVQNDFVDDQEGTTFLLQINQKLQLIPQRTDSLIYCNQMDGPVFGSGHDLKIADHCHMNSDSYSEIFVGYNCSGENKLANNQDNIQMFTGTKEGNNFKIREYQVFKVIWQA